MLKELVTVIIPIYNVEVYLDRCIKSVVNQTYSELEIILVDDGSTDHGPKICDSWAKKDSRIKVIHKQNGGLSDARNAGMRVATGNWIVFLDSDDWIHKDMIRLLRFYQQKSDADIVECRARRTVEDIIDKKINENNIVAREFQSEEAIAALLNEKPLRQTVWNKLYKRTLIEKTEFAFGKFHEDGFWTYQIFAKAGKILYLDVELYYYYQRSDSIMGQAFSLKRLDAIEGRYMRFLFLNVQYPDLVFQAKNNLYFLILFYCQQALRMGTDKEKQIFLKKANEYLKQIVFTSKEREQLSLSDKIWIMLGKINLRFVCKLRNLIKIGIA